MNEWRYTGRDTYAYVAEDGEILETVYRFVNSGICAVDGKKYIDIVSAQAAVEKKFRGEG